MSLTTILVTLAAVAWLAQIVLGGWQIHRFNRAFDALCLRGTAVGVGRSAGRFKARRRLCSARSDRIRQTQTVNEALWLAEI
jgi:glucitol operon activator protein